MTVDDILPQNQAKPGASTAMTTENVVNTWANLLPLSSAGKLQEEQPRVVSRAGVDPRGIGLEDGSQGRPGSRDLGRCRDRAPVLLSWSFLPLRSGLEKRVASVRPSSKVAARTDRSDLRDFHQAAERVGEAHLGRGVGDDVQQGRAADHDREAACP